MRNIAFLLVVGLFLIALASIAIYSYRRTRRSSQATWEDLLKRLVRVDRDSIALVARDAVDESGEPLDGEEAFSLEPAAIWDMLGGLEGVEALEHNCRVFVDLAAYIQRSYPEALVVAEQLRLNAREIEWHAARLKGAAQTGNLQSSFADYAQRAAVTYYLMTRHLLALYDHASFPRIAELQQAI